MSASLPAQPGKARKEGRGISCSGRVDIVEGCERDAALNGVVSE